MTARACASVKSPAEAAQAAASTAAARAVRRRFSMFSPHLEEHELATRDLRGEKLEQWQYEITGAGRVWYCTCF
jgi:hypothetical protein